MVPWDSSPFPILQALGMLARLHEPRCIQVLSYTSFVTCIPGRYALANEVLWPRCPTGAVLEP